MLQRRVLPYLGLMVVMVSTPGLAAEKARELTEKQKIEALLRTVSGLKDVRFVRKETELDGISAAEFLRAKWTYKSDEIGSAHDFIRVCSSAPDGEPYRFELNGESMTAEALLAAELARLE
jgi:hypothetical protein